MLPSWLDRRELGFKKSIAPECDIRSWHDRPVNARVIRVSHPAQLQTKKVASKEAGSEMAQCGAVVNGERQRTGPVPMAFNEQAMVTRNEGLKQCQSKARLCALTHPTMEFGERHHIIFASAACAAN